LSSSLIILAHFTYHMLVLHCPLIVCGDLLIDHIDS
jgi:hypothetical protein